MISRTKFIDGVSELYVLTYLHNHHHTCASKKTQKDKHACVRACICIKKEMPKRLYLQLAQPHGDANFCTVVNNYEVLMRTSDKGRSHE